MYKIYIGEVPILLVAKEDSKKYRTGNIRDMLVEHTPKRRKKLHQYIDNLEKGTKTFDSIIVYAEDLEQLKEDFFSIYKIHKAGGGLVFNELGQVLAIFRGGYWDLPKGKQDPGESIEQTAVREVQEETGLKNLDLGSFICDTFHTYEGKSGQRMLKWSSWFKMTTKDKDLVPQKEEDIELAVWLDIEDLKQKKPIYKNILEVLNNL